MAKLFRAKRRVQDPTGVSGAKVQADLQAPAATQRLGQTIATAGPKIVDAEHRRQDAGNRLERERLKSKIGRELTGLYVPLKSTKGKQAEGIVDKFTVGEKAIIDNDELWLRDDGTPVDPAVREDVEIWMIGQSDNIYNDLAGHVSIQTTVAIRTEMQTVVDDAIESVQTNPSPEFFESTIEDLIIRETGLAENELAGFDPDTLNAKLTQDVSRVTEEYIQAIARSSMSGAEEMEAAVKEGVYDDKLTEKGKDTIEAEVKRQKREHDIQFKEAETARIETVENGWLVKLNDNALTIPEIEQSNMPVSKKKEWVGKLNASTGKNRNRFKESNEFTYAQWATAIEGDLIDKADIEENVQDIRDQIGSSGPDWLSTDDGMKLIKSLRGEAETKEGVKTPKTDAITYKQAKTDFEAGVFGSGEEGKREYGQTVRYLERWKDKNRDGDLGAEYQKITQAGRDRNAGEAVAAWFWGVPDDLGFTTTPSKNRRLLELGIEPTEKDAFEEALIAQEQAATPGKSAEDILDEFYGEE